MPCLFAASSKESAALRAARGQPREFTVACCGLSSAPNATHKSFLRSRGAAELVRGLGATLQDADAQVAGLAALRRLASDSYGQEAVGNAGGVAALLAALAAHPAEAGVHAAALSALAALALHADNEAAAVAAGAAETCVEALGKGLGAPCDAAAAAALRNLCGSAASQKRAAAAGALPALVAALKREGPPSDKVALLSALRNACALPRNKGLAAQAGAIEAVMALLRAAPEQAELQQHALGTLWALAGSAQNKVRIASDGGLELAVAALRAHAAHAGVQEMGLGALASVAWSNVAYKERARRAGALALADAALAAFPNEAAVCTRAAEATARLTQNSDPHGDSFMPNM